MQSLNIIKTFFRGKGTFESHNVAVLTTNINHFRSSLSINEKSKATKYLRKTNNIK